MTYASGRLYEELAYLAYHFHWSMDSLLDLEHAERGRYLTEIGRMWGISRQLVSRLVNEPAPRSSP